MANEEPLGARVDPAASAVRAGAKSWPFELDPGTGGARLLLGDRPTGAFRLRPLLWREKVKLARFAHLGPAFLRGQFLRLAAEGDGPLPDDPERLDALWALAAWVNDPAGDGQSLPLDPVALARAALDLCRASPLRPADLDDRDALEVELLWQVSRRAEEGTPAPGTGGRPADGLDDEDGFTRIVVRPDETGPGRSGWEARLPAGAPDARLGLGADEGAAGAAGWTPRTPSGAPEARSGPGPGGAAEGGAGWTSRPGADAPGASRPLRRAIRQFRLLDPEPEAARAGSRPAGAEGGPAGAETPPDRTSASREAGAGPGSILAPGRLDGGEPGSSGPDIAGRTTRAPAGGALPTRPARWTAPESGVPAVGRRESGGEGGSAADLLALRRASGPGDRSDGRLGPPGTPLAGDGVPAPGPAWLGEELLASATSRAEGGLLVPPAPGELLTTARSSRRGGGRYPHTLHSPARRPAPAAAGDGDWDPLPGSSRAEEATEMAGPAEWAEPGGAPGDRESWFEELSERLAQAAADLGLDVEG